MNGTVVGIDIGATGIRGVEASVHGRTLAVHRAGAVPLPHGAVVGGVVQDEVAVTSALKSLFRKARFRTKSVATVIGADPAVLIRHAVVTYLESESDRNGVVAAKAPEILPVAADKQYLGHHVLSVRPLILEDGTKTSVADIALVAADRDCVDAVVQSIENAGLVPVGIDVTAFALTRFVAMAASGPGHLDVIAHMGAHTISLIGVSGGQPAFQRALNEFAGAKVTAAIQEVLRCSSDVAENLKVDVVNLQGPEAAVVNEVVAVWTNATVDALKTAIVGASTQSSLPIGRVWLSGGGARLATLAPQLKAQLSQGAQVAILDPATWVSKPDRLVRATQSTGQDFTVALAASSR
jgi:type IV pilus assembly protein PilM